jgi:quinol monooxygenase YgiN
MVMIECTILLNEGQSTAMRVAMSQRLKEVRDETGCLSYHLTADLDNPMLFYLFELWTDEPAFMAHVKLPQTTAFSALLGANSQTTYSALRIGTMADYVPDL